MLSAVGSHDNKPFLALPLLFSSLTHPNHRPSTQSPRTAKPIHSKPFYYQPIHRTCLHQPPPRSTSQSSLRIFLPQIGKHVDSLRIPLPPSRQMYSTRAQSIRHARRARRRGSRRVVSRRVGVERASRRSRDPLTGSELTSHAPKHSTSPLSTALVAVGGVRRRSHRTPTPSPAISRM